MRLTKYRLGDFITPYAKRCNNPSLIAEDVSGVNREREFFEPSQQVGTNTSAYKVVPQNYFACNLMHVGRDEVLPIAWNHTQRNKIVSPAYTVFCIKKDAPLLSEYLFMVLKSTEKDRYFWFQTDTSVRDGMSWADFCDVEISIPPLPIQQKYVDIYTALLRNQRAYERGLEDLKRACFALADSFKHHACKVAVGDLLEEVDIRNSESVCTTAHGINITKQFMPSVASSTDLLKYKIVKRNQFAYSAMQTGRDKCIRIALYQGEGVLAVSPAYSVLQKKTDEVLEEYIQMWFSRSESDRLGWFMSDASIRANLDLPRFYEIKIPLPSVPQQKALVNIFNVYTSRRSINERLKALLRDICPILVKGSLEEASA